jgi:hypothetical protein
MLSEVISFRRDEFTQPKHPCRQIKTQPRWVFAVSQQVAPSGKVNDTERAGKTPAP